MNYWILTSTATPMDLLVPTPEMVDIKHLAQALGNVCRFNGHCKHHYSVAQHSILVSSIVEWEGGSPEEALQGLLHDAEEAYIADLTRPLKLLLIEAAHQRNEAWLSILAEAGIDRDSAAMKAAILHLLPDEQGQGLSILVDVYKQVADRIRAAICEAYHMEFELPASVKDADMVALATEKRALLPEHPATWECLNGYEALNGRIEQWTPEQARDHFHERLIALLATTHRRRAAA
ncbi:phosphohydrolase [Aquipseudomonas alcaligenes]|uniref:Phosphohydrolase n=1 Tax=Aquipseudomonas alcaligenes TaxID=43263 RepID=A0AA42SSU8_AQUAC|nr:phosphohydrolase [Pseudomonas alcaligenes]MDH1055274.1 phosphohydrolase [Pseudomonas alcaligenes]